MRLTIPIPNDFDFVECVEAHGWRRLPPFRWADAEAALERVEAFHGRIVMMQMSATTGGLAVEAEIPVDEVELVAHVRRMLQLDLSTERFHRFCREHSDLAGIPSRRQGRLLRSPTLYEDVCKVIATTNTTWSQTIGMVSRLVEHFGLEGRAFPRPEQIAATSLDDFAANARMGYRSAAVHRISTDIAEGRLDLELLHDPSIPSGVLYRRLLALPGIGPYAASCLMIYLGRYDRVNVDSWARMMVGKELGRSVTDKEVHEFFAPYGEWKALVYHFYPWREKGPAL